MIYTNDFRNYRGLYLAHHGIEGQKWGVKNGPPYPLDGGKRQSRSSARKQRKRLKKQDKLIRKQRKQAIRNRRTLTDDELNKLASRIKAETELKRIVENDQSRGKKTVDEILSNSGKKVIGVATVGVMTYGLHILIKSNVVSKDTNKDNAISKIKGAFDPKEAAAYIAPRPKNK